jgi:hypothetical protein
MTLLILGIVVFLGVHLLPTFHDVRETLIGRLGENGYKALFSLLSIVGFVLLVWGFAKAPVVQVWSPPTWTRYVAMVLMLPVFILLIAAYVPGQIKAKVKHPFVDAISTLGARPSHRQWRPRLDHPVRLVPRLLRVRPYRAEAPPRDRPRHGCGNRAGAQRRDQRGGRTAVLRALSRLAAPDPDRDLALALVENPTATVGYLDLRRGERRGNRGT